MLVMVLAVVFGVWMARRRAVDLVAAAVARRRADDPAVRLPDPGPGPLRRRPGSPRSSPASSTPRRSRSSWSPTGSRASRRPRSRPRARPAPPPGRRSPRCSCRWPAARWCWRPTRACSTCCRWSSSAAWSAPRRLGYDVVLGFSRSEEWGKGAAAGITIVLLGIMLDRIMRPRPARRRHARPEQAPWWQPRPADGPQLGTADRTRNATRRWNAEHADRMEAGSGPGCGRGVRDARARRLRQ